MNGSTQFQRLSKSIFPQNYNLFLSIDTEGEIFVGKVEIIVKINQITSNIFLHSAELKLKSATIEQGNNTFFPHIIEKPAIQGVELKTESTLTEGTATINIEYESRITSKLFGLYKTEYIYEGETVKCAVTDLEPGYARYVLPCFDEPDFKAIFSVSVVARRDQTVLSNMDTNFCEPWGSEDLVVTHFQPSPLMSSYLLAVVVGKFDFVEEVGENGVKVRVYASLGKTEEAKPALDAAVRALSFYNNFFDLPFVLNKLDLIAIPDFATSAMENWGLITFRETAFLVKESSSMSIKQRMAVVVAHELAHMWFGNLVTMEWWTYLWLNEGFATWISYLCVDYIFPEYDIWSMFQIKEINTAMDLDSLESSHPIEISVGSPSEAEEMFDKISYAKGSSVIGYLYQFLGNEVFRRGIRIYIKRFVYKNTVSTDLWNALSEASGYDVAELMNCWISCKGFPYLSVYIVPTDVTDYVELSIEQFPCTRSSGNSTIWQIPYNFVQKSNPKKVTENLLKTKKTSLKLRIQPNEWIKFNVGNVGFYRVNYIGNLKDVVIDLVSQLDCNGRSVLSIRDKVGLLGDFLSLACIGEMSLVDGLTLCWSLRNEVDYYVWSGILSILMMVDSILQNTPSYEIFVRFVNIMINLPYNYVGWEPVEAEENSKSLLRTAIFEAMARFGGDDFKEECRSAFGTFIKGGPVNADLQTAVISSVMLNGTQKDLCSLIEYYKGCGPEEKSRILSSVGFTTNPEFIDEVFKFAFSDCVKGQDLIYVFAGLTALKCNSAIVWEYFKTQNKQIMDKLSNPLLISKVIPYVTSMFITDEEISSMKTFFSDYDLKCVNQCIEMVEMRNSLFEKNASQINHFLTNFN